ncbi:helix-turn-helix domain-containing protein [Nonomuraea sp. KM90]|uniref:helix-turn-helix domain-containing protein n=1 Tax=Nonomuraea sp. KM90 TaxID=3457428 RepID=UPI003FCE535E
MARGGRRDRPIDRRSGPSAGFVDDLRRLRGAMSLQEIGTRMGYHSSTVSRRLNPDEPPPLDFVRAYVTACGADPGPWEERWRGLTEEMPERQTPNGPVRRPRRRWIVLGAVTVVIVVAGVVVLAVVLLRPSGSEPSAVSVSTTSPEPPERGTGFPWRIDRMSTRLTSRTWSQTAEGSIEIWADLACPRSAAPYWIALRPEGEAVRFTCGSWQHHRWERVPPGNHHFEVWKDADGQALSGVGALRASTPIVERPKASD